MHSYNQHKTATLILSIRLFCIIRIAFLIPQLRILGDEDIAQDAAQEAFISAFRSINTFRGGSFKAWLLRTVTNACYDELRRQKRRPTTPLEPETNDGEEMDSPRWLADPNMTPAEKSEADELEHAIQHCLDALPTDFRTVVVLADIQGMDYSEVATAAHVPLGTIKSRLARARLRLRECLRGFEELLPSSFRLEEESNLMKNFHDIEQLSSYLDGQLNSI